MTNVLMLIMDATRADHLSCYGYERPTSPTLDRLAETGVLYEQCISPSSWTLPTMASIYTGLFVSQHGTSFLHQFLDTHWTTLGEVMQRAGYRTAMFGTGGWINRTFGFQRGFDCFETEVRGYKPLRRWFPQTTRIEKLARHIEKRLTADTQGKMTKRLSQNARRWLNADDETPFFAVIHFADPHWPYFRHRGFTPTREGRPSPWVFGMDGHKIITGEIEATDAYLDMLTDYYDGEIAFLDHAIGQLLDQLSEDGLLHDTLIIITADHGEHLGEHMLTGHGNSMYEPIIHVPLIMRHPEYAHGGERVPSLVQTTEIFTTLLNLVGLTPDDVPNDVRGRALWPSHVAQAPLSFAVSEDPAPNVRRLARLTPDFDTTALEQPLRAIRTEQEKFIWRGDGAHEFYDLASDPRETTNRIAHMPERAAQLHAMLTKWVESINPLDVNVLEQTLDDDLIAQLKSLGYL